jgi:hypothetical protein
MKIIVLGNMQPRNQAYGLVQCLERLGHQVYPLDSQPTSTLWNHLKGFNEARIKNCVIVDIAHFLPPEDCDLLIYIMDKITYSFENLRIPWYFVNTDLLFPRLPLGGLQYFLGVFNNFLGGQDRLKDLYPYQMNHLHFNKVLPYGVSKDLFLNPKPYGDRKISIGFMGSFEMDCHSPNSEKRNIYTTRQYVYDFLKRTYPRELILRGNSGFKDYQAFMQETQIHVNVAGDNCDINQRMFEVCLSKGLLIQWYFYGLEKLAFKDKENCLIVRNLEQLSKALDWALNNPNEANQIAEQGYKTILQHYIQEFQGEKIFDTITHYETHTVEHIEVVQQLYDAIDEVNFHRLSLPSWVTIIDNQ